MIFHYDNSPSCSNCLRIIISHISFIIEENDLVSAQEILTNFKNFLFEKVSFQEVHLSLHYNFIDDNFIIDKGLLNIFRNVLLFKWLKLENTMKERILILYLKNPNSESIQNINYLKKTVYTLKIKYLSNFQISNVEDKNEISNSGKEINCFPILFSLFDLVTSDNNYYINFKGFKPNKFGYLKKNCSQFLSYCYDFKENVFSNFIIPQIEDFNKDLINYFEPGKIFSSIIDINSKFENITSTVKTIENKQYFYNVIEVERIEVLINKDNPLKEFYLIRLNDKNALFVSELEREAYQKEANLCHYFYKIYSKLEPIKSELKNKILIPAFNLNTKSSYDFPNVFPQLSIEKDLKNYDISKFLEYSNITMDYDLEYEYSVHKNFDENTFYKIENNFIFGILNYDILSELNIPTSFITYISKDNWYEKK